MWLPSPVSGSGALVVETYVPRTASVQIAVNGNHGESRALDKGWNEVRVSVPNLRADNEVRLQFDSLNRIGGVRSPAAIARVAVGRFDGLSATAHTAREQGPLKLEPGRGAMWHIWSTADAQIHVDLADDGCSATLSCGTGNDGQTPCGSEVLDRDGALLTDLPSKQVARLQIVASSEGDCDELTVARAQVVRPGMAPQVPDFEPPRHILFWMIDTLRADHLPLYADTDVQAPNLVKLAEEGALFKLAYVEGNESRVSHSSLFTGAYPSRHGVSRDGILLPRHQLLTEEIRKHGINTLGVVANGYVSGKWGFEQGWDHYRNTLRQGGGITAAALVDRTRKLVSDNVDNRVFMYVGTIDPHVAYRRRGDLINLYSDPSYSGRFERSITGVDLGRIATKKMAVTEPEKQRIHALYKNEITYNDQEFGRLRKAFEDLGIWDQTLTIVTADHGEQFWDHGSVGHGSGVHQEIVHVPLILRYPPMIPTGSVVEPGVDIIDIYPTILAAIGVDELPPDVQGHSMLPLVHGVRGGYPEPAIATHYMARYGLQLGPWKLVVKRGAYALYDRSNDPGEHTDVAGAHPLAERWVMDVFGVFRPLRAKWKKATMGPPSNLLPGFGQVSGPGVTN